MTTPATPRRLALAATAGLALVLASCGDGEQGAAPATDDELPPASSSNPLSSDRSPAEAPGDSQATRTTAPGDDRVIVSGVAMTVPEQWVSVTPSNSMRQAQYVVPAPEGAGLDDAEFTVFALGGGIDMNIDRWVGQFSNPAGEVVSSRETRQLAGRTVHLVEMSGEYRGMGMRPPEPDTMMRAAIVEQPSGQHLFIKMTGPIAHMQTLGEGWETMISSLRSP